MLFKTINQCNSFKTGMMWACFLVKQSSLAAAQSHRSYILVAECFFFYFTDREFIIITFLTNHFNEQGN